MILCSVTLVVVPFTTMAKDKAEIPEYTVEGLKLIPNTSEIAYVWAEPGADLSQYSRVYLVEPAVAFRSNWRRDFNRNQSSLASRVTSSDMDRIKAGVSEIFIEVFTEELEAGGHELTNEKAEDVLIVRAAIIDLDVAAPDLRTASRTSTFTTSAGSMTLYMELYDSETGDLLAKALDPTSDRESAVLQWQTGASNRVAARRMMQPWAVALRNGLDEARKATKQVEE